MAATGEQITLLLHAMDAGKEASPDKLFPLVYDELRSRARHLMGGERRDHTLQATALVHEAFLKVARPGVSFQSRLHFFNAAALAMRRILVEHARRHNVKRGGGVPHVSLEEAGEVGSDRPPDLVALDDAMNALARFDARKAQIVEMRFFGGLDVKETAAVPNVSPSTVMRDWNTAKAWLYRELAGGTGDAV